MAQLDPLTEERHWLAKKEAEYLRAKDYVKSGEFESDVLGIVAKIKKLVPTGRDWNGDKALFALGAVDYVITEFAAKTSIIAEYESKKQSVDRFNGR